MEPTRVRRVGEREGILMTRKDRPGTPKHTYGKDGVVKEPNPLTPHVEGTTKARKKDGKGFVHRERPAEGVRKKPSKAGGAAAPPQ
jgi:hypothetical protein